MVYEDHIYNEKNDKSVFIQLFYAKYTSYILIKIHFIT